MTGWQVWCVYPDCTETSAVNTGALATMSAEVETAIAELRTAGWCTSPTLCPEHNAQAERELATTSGGSR